MARQTILTTILFLAVLSTHAQSNDDFGLDIAIGCEKKLTKALSMDFEADFRSQDNTSHPERWSVGGGLEYKIINKKKYSIKAAAGWEHIWQYHLQESKLTQKGNKKITDAFWRNRHRTSVSIAGQYSPNKHWTVSLKETAQYNHFASASTIERKFDKINGSDGIYFDEEDPEIEKKTFNSADRFILRSKMTVQYEIRHCPLSPFASVDYGYGLNYSANKWKMSAGTDIKIDKHNKLSVFYRYQTENDDDEANGHIIGVSYGFKF